MKQQDIEDLKQLIEFLKQHQIAEFDLDRGDLKIRLKFNQQETTQAGLGDLARLLSSAPASAAAVSAAPAAAGSAPATPQAPKEDPDAGLHMVKSPIVGTYYGSPSPGAAAFVSPGDHVEKGQVICIVEAMKLMNEIEAELEGRVAEILVKNGEHVEYGQALIRLLPA